MVGTNDGSMVEQMTVAVETVDRRLCCRRKSDDLLHKSILTVNDVFYPYLTQKDSNARSMLVAVPTVSSILGGLRTGSGLHTFSQRI